MFRALLVLAALMSSISAANESAIRLLDNRFRVDSSIEQITFVVYREESSKPVVLVRPDGKKYYAWKNYDNLRWYQESSLDVISIDKPMPGPWQAVGKVSPKNRILLVSHLKLTADKFPRRLYKSEQIKFTARLTSEGQPLSIRDLLDRVNLRVVFTKFVEDEEVLVKEARPVPVTLGEFVDDGTGMDEKADDGIFTVQLSIDIKPGKYRARVTSGNGVFLRVQEQIVWVYPEPYTQAFIQAREDDKRHRMIIDAEQDMIQAGSLVASIEQVAPDGYKSYLQAQTAEGEQSMILLLDNDPALGQYTVGGEIFATDQDTQRGLIFPLPEKSYIVVAGIDQEAIRKQKEAEAEQLRLMELEKKRIAEREAERKSNLMMVAIGNIVVLILGVIGWFVMRKLKERKEAMPEMQLVVPKK